MGDLQESPLISLFYAKHCTISQVILRFLFVSITAAVEACLLLGLKKRALGLFKNSTTTALLQKVSKNFEPAAQIVKIINEIENNNDTK